MKCLPPQHPLPETHTVNNADSPEDVFIILWLIPLQSSKPGRHKGRNEEEGEPYGADSHNINVMLICTQLATGCQ